MSRIIKLVLEYDGTDFYGWQVQPSHRTVQGEVEKALSSLVRQKIRVTAAGRTDTGVHALGQVVSFRYEGSMNIHAFKNGLNAFLPRDVRIMTSEEASLNFNARRDAIRRVYRYVIAKTERAVGRQYAWYPGFQINLELVRQGSAFLLGTHEWQAFSRPDPDVRSMKSTVYDVQWYNYETEIHFEISAVKFFHSMIRLIIGTLVDVGRGYIDPEKIREILESGDLSQASAKAPACGLFLLKVEYRG